MSNNQFNADQVKFFYGGNYTTLEDYARRRKVIRFPWKTVQAVTIPTQNYALLNSTMLPGFNIAKDTTTTQENNAIFAASLAGSVGAGSISYVTDTAGNILNRVEIRDQATNNPIEDTDERICFGLIQCDNTAVDGSAIGAAASENLQISICKEDASGNIVLVAINKTIEFQVNGVLAAKFEPPLMMENGLPGSDTKDLASVNSLARVYIIGTNIFPVGGQINLATDALTSAGSATVDVSDPRSQVLSGSPLPNTGALFATNSKIRFFRNGQLLTKSDLTGSGDIGYVSSTTIQVNVQMAVGEELMVEVPQGY